MNVFLHLWTVVLHSILVEGQAAGRQFELDVRLETYRNPTNTLAAGACCTGNGRNCGNEPCNNRFILCAGPRGSETVITLGRCPYGRFDFTANSDDITFLVGPSIVPNSPLPNPILFLGRSAESVPNDLELDIEILNIVSGGTELVERFTLAGSLTPSDMFGSTQTYRGRRDLALTASFRLRCSPNYFGVNCSIFCAPTERFTCDPLTGDIVCREGYLDEATNCSVCVPATGCNTTNGYCTLPGECVCLQGFTGALCNQSTGSNSGSISGGGVAGVVIAVLLILAIIALGAGAGIVLWVYQPWSNGWFGLEARLMKRTNDAIENPVYEDTDIGTPQTNGQTPVEGVRYMPIKDVATSNGHAHLATANVDDDNPLYASSALEKILNPGEGEHMGKGQHKPSTGNSNGVVLRGNQQIPIPTIGTLRESSSLENILRNADSAVEPPSPKPNGRRKEPVKKPYKLNSLPREGQQVAAKSSLAASQSLDNLLKPSNALNPYGEYSDQTLQRAVSGNTFSETASGENTSPNKDTKVFDNPDYEFVAVDSSQSDQPQPVDLDYDTVS